MALAAASSLLPIIGTAIQAGWYLWNAPTELKKNKEECEQFGRHVQTVLKLIKVEVEHRRGSEHYARIARTCEYVTSRCVTQI